jgi:hypothetical protein
MDERRFVIPCNVFYACFSLASPMSSGVLLTNEAKRYMPMINYPHVAGSVECMVGTLLFDFA